jgi:hypothetical protein
MEGEITAQRRMEMIGEAMDDRRLVARPGKQFVVLLDEVAERIDEYLEQSDLAVSFILHRDHVRIVSYEYACAYHSAR